MTGSLQEKRGKYYIVVNFKDKEGNWKHKWISTGLSIKGNNVREANKMLKEVLDEYADAEGGLTDNCLFTEMLARWLDTAKLKLDIVTYEGYEHTVNRHLLPYFAKQKLKVNEIKPDTIQQYYIKKMKNGRLDGKGGLSAKSIKQHHTVIYQTMDYAMKNRIVSYNPAAVVTVPKPVPYKADFYNVAETKKLLKAIKNEFLYPIVLLTVYYGLRRSEVTGLKWRAVDFENHTVTIEHTQVRSFSLVQKDKTKNPASHRTYPLFDFIERELLKVKATQDLNRELFAGNYIETGYVFCWADGNEVEPGYVTRNFSRLLDKYMFRHIRLHDLRHSCASMLIALGFSLKEIQEWLGHSDIRMTGDVYGHLESASKVALAKQFAQRLNPDADENKSCEEAQVC